MKTFISILKGAVLPSLSIFALIHGVNDANAAVVNSLADDGSSGTLRYAIQHANIDPNITFAGGLSGTIVLTGGELQIPGNATITGPGANILAIDGNGGNRIFHVQSGSIATISGLTLQHGLAAADAGGAILNEGTLNLYQCYLAGNISQGADINCSGSCTAYPGMGGAISSSGNLSMTACTVAYCQALGGRAFASGQGEGGAGIGGGLYVSGSMALTNCTLTWNKALGGQHVGAIDTDGSSGGGAIYCANATGPLTLVNCTVSGNQAGDVGHADLNYGGGITTDFIGTLNLINCIAAGNYQVCCSEDIRSRETPIYGTFTSGGGNILTSSDPTIVGFVNVNGGTDLYTGSVDSVRLWWQLENDGGPTPILPLVAGSPGGSIAIDAGNDIVLGAPYNLTTDQRGYPRPGLGTLHVDSGAYEASFNVPCYSCSTYNSWNVGIGGSWDFSSNWGGGSPGPGSSVLITNSGNKTVSIDGFSSTNSLHISDLRVSGPTNTVNSLLVNAGPALPLQIDGTFTLLKGSSLDVSNSIIYMHPHGPGPDPAPTNAAFANGSSVVIDGPASFHNNATFDTSSAFDLTIGNRAAGSLAMSDSALNAYDVFVGSAASGTAVFSNTTASLSRTLFIATSVGNTGAVSVVGGTLVATNLTCHVSPCTSLPSLVMERGISQLTISSNATVQFGSGLLGAFGGSATLTEQSGSLSFNGDLQLINGTMNLQGGTLSVAGDFSAATGSNSFAQINISGGTLLASNSTINVGSGGSGTMTISNATVVAQRVKLGGTNGLGSGALRLKSGILRVLGLIGCEVCGFSTNDGEVDGGDMDASGASIVVGENHNAAFTVTGGTIEADNLFIGYDAGFTGTYIQSGGTVSIASNITVGGCVTGALGIANLSGGTLYVTNAAHNATLLVSSGTVTVSPGATLVADIIIITNSCGHLVKNGGVVSYGQLILDPNLDADGDGIPNGVEQANGFDPLSSANTFQVINNNDSGAGSLRAAVASANASPGSAIDFAPNVTGVITLTSGELPLAASTLVFGPGAKVLAVSGNNASRVFNLGAGTVVTMYGLTVTNGLAAGSYGGGIFNNHATLTLHECAVCGNHAQQGAGLYNLGAGSGGAVMNLINSTISGNAANSIGGAIVNDGSSGGSAALALTNCTVSDNTGSVGGIDNEAENPGTGTLTVFACTFSGNSGAGGGGILNDGTGGGNATLVIGDTLLNAGASGPNLVNSAGTVISRGFNLSSDAAGGDGTQGPGGLLNATGDQRNTNPMLDPAGLRDNGGNTPTIALLPGSPAVDQGLSGPGVLDQQQSSGPNTTGGPDTWQSFTAGVGGALTQVGLGHWNTPTGSDAPGTLRIYAGEGTSGALLATTAVTFSNVVGLQLFTIQTPPQIVAGSQYTFRVTIPDAPSVAWVLVDVANPYSGGRAESGANYDYVFQTFVVPRKTDQRGFPRPYDNPSIANAAGGDGSDIGAFELIIPPSLTAVRSGGGVIVSWPDVSNFTFTLQQNSDYSNPGGWTTSGYPITTANGTNSITINPAAGKLFFRLKE